MVESVVVSAADVVRRTFTEAVDRDGGLAFVEFSAVARENLCAFRVYDVAERFGGVGGAQSRGIVRSGDDRHGFIVIQRIRLLDPNAQQLAKWAGEPVQEAQVR